MQDACEWMRKERITSSETPLASLVAAAFERCRYGQSGGGRGAFNITRHDVE
jgi:hypothetical protein